MSHQPPKIIQKNPKKRILFLTKNLELIKRQLYEGLDLKWQDVKPADLLDDINTDVMTPAWVCFHHDPKEIAKRAYAGLLLQGERVFRDNALIDGNFEAIVSGHRKGTGSSRETAAQCEHFAGIKYVFAASFAPIHQRNNINLGQIMGGYDLLSRFHGGDAIPFEDFLAPFDPLSQDILRAGGLFPFLENYQTRASSKASTRQPLNMAQKIMAPKVIGPLGAMLEYQSVIAKVDGGYSHEFTTAQVHRFLAEYFGEDYEIKNGRQFAAFEDHLIYTDQVAKYKPHMPLIEDLRKIQKEFITRNNIRDYSAVDGISPGICHEVAREDFILPGDFIQATDSHTCMGGALNAFAFGIGATEYAALIKTGLTVVKVPASMRYELTGRLRPECTAKDVILHILATHTRQGLTLDKVMEFGGEGLKSLSMDERATLCNMATECGAKTGICEPDEKLVSWILEHRADTSRLELQKRLCPPDAGCRYDGGIYSINLDTIEPMAAHPGNPDLGIPSDPTNGVLIKDLPPTPIDIAYGGSCTAGKYDDIAMYAQVCAMAQKQGRKIPAGVSFYIQYGTKDVQRFAIDKGFDGLFRSLGVNLIPPGCGACIGCGPGVSERPEQVTVSAINRNFQGRSGPGKLYLASPLSVAASAFLGRIGSILELS